MSITLEQFDSLLMWLGDGDRDTGAAKYETIRAGLLRVFISRGFSDAEDLTDETINRVIIRLPDIRENYDGEPTRYFHGVARNIIRETNRRKEISAEVSAVWVDPQPTSEERECLDRCLQQLPAEKRELILDYFLYEGHDKVEHHKALAAELGISEGALRGRVHHIRASLVNCMRQCAEGNFVTKVPSKAIVSEGSFGGGKPSIKTETIS
ncbi:MAG TPA: RNA polymerase sigma factor [Pyrinomonadaceae bacterium]|nr:RNA polymerase sigma factor [Pyrinomonadaceae bacterium]